MNNLVYASRRLILILAGGVSSAGGCIFDLPEVAKQDAGAVVDPPDAQPEGEVDCSLGDGTRCPGGICFSGACCTGCWDGATCHAGDALDRCGREGTSCSTCACDSDLCTDGLCVPVSPIRHLGVGTSHTCVVLMNGTLWCWGANGSGQIGTSEPSPSEPIPHRLDSATDWAMVAGGNGHTCGIKLDGTRICWGNNDIGQLGVGNIDPYGGPVSAAERASDLGLGFSYGCAIGVTRVATCWGNDDHGQLGSGHTALPGVPTQITGGGQFEDLSVGRRHACAVHIDRSLWCWGTNINGDLGLGDFLDRDVPTRVGVESTWKQVAAGGFQTCARMTDETLYCWGGNHFGQLGQGIVGPGTDENTPQRVGTESTWAHVGSGRSHLCGLRDQGELWCWGRNDGGQVGIGSLEDSHSPTRVGMANDWTDTGGGEAHTCGTREGGTLYCWGTNDVGQLGVPGGPLLAPTRVCIPAHTP